MVELKTSHKLAAGLLALLVIGVVVYLTFIETPSQPQERPQAHLFDGSRSPTSDQPATLAASADFSSLPSSSVPQEQPKMVPGSVTSLANLVRLPATTTPNPNSVPTLPATSSPDSRQTGPLGEANGARVASVPELTSPPPQPSSSTLFTPKQAEIGGQSADVAPTIVDATATSAKPVEISSEPLSTPVTEATPNPALVSSSPQSEPSVTLAPLPPPPPPPPVASLPPTSTLIESDDERIAWESFKITYNRTYEHPDEDLKRHAQFLENLRFINTFNQQSGALFSLGVNHFADKSRDEINSQLIGPTVPWSNLLGQLNVPAPPPIPILRDTSVSNHVDWRKALPSIVYDQGTCRDSAVFATVSALEAARTILTAAPPRTLSLRQLFECIDLQGLPTCQGLTTVPQVLDLVKQQPAGLVTSDMYEEYLRHTPQPGNRQCGITMPEDGSFAMDQSSRVRLQSFAMLHKDNMMEAVISSPLLVALDASQSSFHFYRDGLYHETNCSNQVFNQNALLVANLPAGDAGMPFDHLVIRNSFGQHWGMSGYMRMLKDESRNRCLPQQLAFMPVLVAQ